jgi:hypothetical protein
VLESYILPNGSDWMTCVSLEGYMITYLSSVVQLALIAQLVERVTSNDEVAGSTPS